MKKLHEKNDLTFAIAWIVAYCVVSIPIRGEYGDESLAMLLGLGALAAVLLVFLWKNRLTQSYGLKKWEGKARDYLYFIPMLVLMTGNLWGGVGMAYQGMAQVYAVLSMLLVGLIEELIFRGLLFRALLKRDPAPVAITISAVTFGIGHLVNLFAGQGGLESLLQVAFAIAWGYIFTLVYYHSGSLWVCIGVHGLVDVFSKFSVAAPMWEIIYSAVTIVVSAVYCVYLTRKPAALKQE